MSLLELAERLDHYQSSPSGRAMAYFFVHCYEDALAGCEPLHGPLQAEKSAWLFKAAAYAEFGRMDDARAAIAKALALDADLRAQGERRRRPRLGLLRATPST